MKLKFFLPLALIFLSCLANDFLSSTVTGTNYTVGKIWTGFDNYLTYIKETPFTVERAVPQPYIDYPIEIIVNFLDTTNAPLWKGMSPGGTLDFSGMKSIKILKHDTDDIWKDIPSQISYKTKCHGTYGLVDCSSTNYKIELLLSNIKLSLRSFDFTNKIIYSLAGENS